MISFFVPNVMLKYAQNAGMHKTVICVLLARRMLIQRNTKKRTYTN
jgi:hypothetical protein